MAKLLLCFKPFGSAEDISELPRSRLPRSGNGHPHSPGRLATQDTHRTVAFVELLKHTNEPLGLALEGGTDRDVPVHVGALRPGGVAEKSGALQIGDHILSINGTATERLTHNEVCALLENAGNVINLEIAFESPNGAEVDDSTIKKKAVIKLPRESPTSYGFTISGGKNENRPITVSNVTVGSAAYRQGILKAGDRILKVNGVDVSHASQMETHSLLKTVEGTCTLEIEYDVTLHDGLAEATSALLVELLKPKGVSLGLNLRESLIRGAPLMISRIKLAGIADRCGALHVGDRLLSVGGVSLENKNIEEVNQMLKKCDLHVQLEIIPGHNYPDEEELALNAGESVSRLSHLPLSTSQLSGAQSQLSLVSSATSTGHLVSHPETMTVTLKADEYGFGLSLQGGATERVNYPLVIANIEDLGPAAKLGQLQVGDEILAINGVRMEGVTLQQAVKLVQEANDMIDLEVLFTVNDAIVPTSGTFEMTMQRTSTLTLGITINGSHRQGDPIWISNLKKGGIASRMGMLQAGDMLLAVNGESLENATLRDAAKMLRNAGDVVTLTVSKEAVPVSRKQEAIIFSVELQRNNQSLGITLTGNNDRGGCPTISRIKEGGVAHKTGTLKVGDKVLAINGESLFNKTVSDAVRILQAAGDVVTLKISKSTRRTRSRPKASSPTGKGRHRDFSAFQRNMMSRTPRMGGGSRMSPLSGFGRHGFGQPRVYHHHRLSQESFSGRSTPDNHSIVSLSRYIGDGLQSPDALVEHDDILDRLTPSEAESTYSRPPPSTVSGVPHSSRVWSYLQDHYQLAGSPTRSPPSLPGAYPPSPLSNQPPRLLRPNPFSAPQLHPHEFHHRGGLNMQHLPATPTTPDAVAKGNVSSDFDEELSVYHEHSRRDPGYRRASLPVSSGAALPTGYGLTTSTSNTTESSNKKWDFKYHRSRRAYRGRGSIGSSGHDAMGRMSPYAASDTERFTPSSPDHNHLGNSLHEHSLGPPMMADPVKRVSVGSSRTQRNSSHSPVKASSPVPIEPSTMHQHSYHYAQSSPQSHPQGSSVGSESKALVDSYDDEDDLDNGAKAASGGSRSGSKMSSSQGSRSDFDHEEGPTTEQMNSIQLRAGTDVGIGDRDSSYTSPEPSFPDMNIKTRSSLRLNISSTQTPLPPYEPSPHHTAYQSQQQKKLRVHHQPLTVDETLRSHSLHTTEDVEPVQFATSSTPSLGHAKLISQHAVSNKSRNPAKEDYQTPKLELAHDLSRKLMMASGSQSPMTDVPSTGIASSSLTYNGSSSSDLESLQKTTQGSLSESALKSVETLNGIQQSINKAINFEQALKALAESGSSDQDSDSEPHSSQGLSIPQHEQQKISDKMKTSVPPQQIVVHLSKPPATGSFGFSVADGRYDQGVYVKAVKPGGPADGVDGLRPYDRIVKVNNHDITSEVNCKTILPLFKEGDELTLLVARSLTVVPFQ